MSLIRLQQPCNYIYKGREVIVESTEISTIINGADGTIVQLKDGRTFTVSQTPDEVVTFVNRAKGAK